MEKEKVGLVTLFRDNFGSILQAYATYNYINSLGFHCTLLDYDFSLNLVDKLKRLPIFIYRSLRFEDFWKNYINQKKAASVDRNLLSECTKEKMRNYVESTFEIRKCSKANIKSIATEFDYFVTGSDQVWNGYSDFTFLTFAKREKRVSLAPSFGKEYVSKYDVRKVTKALNGFDVLSTREESGIRIIKELTGKDAFRLPDPTILLDKNEWKSFSDSGIKKSSYILLHFLNKPSQYAINMIRDFLQTHDCMAYAICNRYKEYLKLPNCEFVDITPIDYVSLIGGANIVFTDSFHSTLFSLNLETQFFTFERQYTHGISQKSRIIDLLDRTGMRDRYVTCSQVNNYDLLEVWNSDLLFGEDKSRIRKYINEALIKKEQVKENGKI